MNTETEWAEPISPIPWTMRRWSGEQPEFFALHGFTGAGLDFAPLAQALPYAITAPDLPGHAGAPMPTGETGFLGLADELARCIRKPMFILGYSMGGRIALALALRHPEKVLGLVLVGASPGIEDSVERDARRVHDDMLSRRVHSLGVEAFLHAWNEQPIIASQARIEESAREAMAGQRRLHTADGLAWSLLHTGTGVMPSLWEAIDGLEPPTLAIAGSTDEKFRDIAREMSLRSTRTETAEAADAGHCAHLENPAAVGALIEAFIERHKPRELTS